MSRDASQFERWYFREHNIPSETFRIPMSLTDPRSTGDHSSRLRLSEDSLSWNTLRFTKDERICPGRRPVRVPCPVPISRVSRYLIENHERSDFYVRSALSVIISLLKYLAEVFGFEVALRFSRKELNTHVF